MILITLALFTICSAEQLYLPPDSANVVEARSKYAGIRTADGRAAILRLAAETTDNGYHYNYETENGIQQSESGQEADGIQAEGSYSYTGTDGQLYSISYTAGSNGFQARGAHIPTEPPLPAEILAALEQNARDELNGIFDDGSYKPDRTDFQVSQPDSEIIAARSFSEQRAIHAQQENALIAQQNNIIARQNAYGRKRRVAVTDDTKEDTQAKKSAPRHL